MNESIYISESFCVSEFGKVEVTSTPAENSFFRALSLLKLYVGLQYHIYSSFRQTSKNFEGGLPKHILGKNTFSEKRVSKYGRLTVHTNFALGSRCEVYNIQLDRSFIFCGRTAHCTSERVPPFSDNGLVR
jgi:hypothetical protein